LRADDQFALAYEKLKVELSLRFAADRAAYTDGKTKFARDIVTSRLRDAKLLTRSERT
jgi:GrpB-like predicted nucleotidyltransferase (UPF0157 family)